MTVTHTIARPAGFVIEGPDGGGKSTLSKRLERQLFWPVVHVAQPGTPNIEQMKALLGVGSVIFDRYHLSPIVYGEVLRGGREMSEGQEESFNQALIAQGYTLVICIADIDTMLDNNWKVDQLWDAVREREVLERLTESYLTCLVRAHHSGLRAVVWDYRAQSPEAFSNLLTVC